MKITNYYYADFETTKVVIPKEYKNAYDYYKNSDKVDVPKIYSWVISPNKNDKWVDQKVNTKESYFKSKWYKDLQMFYGIRGEDFLKFIESFSTDTIVYFNNLKGFDGHFIIPLLDQAGYKSVLPYDFNSDMSGEVKTQYLARISRIKKQILLSKTNKEKYESFKESKEKNKWLEELVRKRWRKLLPKEYSLMINGASQIYEIKIGIASLKRTKGQYTARAVIIRDNLLIFPSSVKNMGESLAKYHNKINGMNLEKAKENFYKKDLLSSYSRTNIYESFKELENDGNELDYVFQDVYILREFHKALEEYFPRSKWQLTIGSTSFKLWLNTLGKKITEQLVKKGELEEIELKRGGIRYVENKTNKAYSTNSMYKIQVNKLLPTDWLNNEDKNGDKTWTHLYKWYKGGITHVNEMWRGKLIEDVWGNDINSSYPSQQVKDVQVPIGRGIKGNVKGYDFHYYTLTPKKKIFNKTGLPFLFSEQKEKREWARILKPNNRYKLTSITLPRFLKYYKCSHKDYNLKIEWSFKTTPIKNIFGDFINKWYKVKTESKQSGNIIISIIAKLFMNSLYGKMGTKIIRESMYWDQIAKQFIKYSEDVEAKYYLPLAIAITELAQMSLVDAVNHNYKDFIYCDTDSIYTAGFDNKEYNLDLHPVRLGAWDTEMKNGTGIFRRSKQYIIKSKDKDKLVYAGINFDRYRFFEKDRNGDFEKFTKVKRKISFKDFILGKTLDNQLSPYKIVGTGIVLSESTKDIKPIWDYDPLEEQERYSEEHFNDTLKKLNK